MRSKRSTLPCSALSVLERAYARRRTRHPLTFQGLAGDFPGVSKSVRSRAIACLAGGGLIRGRRYPGPRIPGRPGMAPKWWRPTPRGLQLLGVLAPYREIWLDLDPAEISALAAGLKTMERIERRHAELFPDGVPVLVGSAYYKSAFRRKIVI